MRSVQWHQLSLLQELDEPTPLRPASSPPGPHPGGDKRATELCTACGYVVAIHNPDACEVDECPLAHITHPS